MAGMRLSNGGWKVLLSLMAFCATMLWVIELPGAIDAVRSGQVGDIGADLARVPEWGARQWSILALDPSSPLASAGATVNDRILFDRLEDGIRVIPGESVGLTLVHDSTERHLIVSAVATDVPPDRLFFEVGTAAICLIPVLLGLLIGFRQPAIAAYRALSLGFTALGLGLAGSFTDFLPAGVPASTVYWVYTVMAPVVVYCSTLFAVLYPDDRPVGLRRILSRYVLPIFGLACLAQAVLGGVELVGYSAPASGVLSRVIQLGRFVIIFAALIAGWLASTGALRLRYKWLIASIGLWTLVATLTSLDWQIHGWQVGGVVYPIGFVVALVLLTYSVLRHRIFDVGFMLNRAAVYTITSALLLVAFGLFEWAAEQLLHFDGREENMALDAGLALAVFLAFHRFRDIVEHWVERLLFHQWHARETALRLFVRRAAHFTTEQALLDALVAAMGQFTGGAGCTVYLQSSDGSYEQARSSLAAAPPRLGADAPGIVALRESNTPLVDDDDVPAGEVALPMTHRGLLNGVIALGPKPADDVYRPDELEILGFAAHQIGLDLQALRIEVLVAENERLKARAASVEPMAQALQLAVQSLAGSFHRPVASD